MSLLQDIPAITSLHISGNPFCSGQDCKQHLVVALPQLLLLDGRQVQHEDGHQDHQQQQQPEGLHQQQQQIVYQHLQQKQSEGEIQQQAAKQQLQWGDQQWSKHGCEDHKEVDWQQQQQRLAVIEAVRPQAHSQQHHHQQQAHGDQQQQAHGDQQQQQQEEEETAFSATHSQERQHLMLSCTEPYAVDQPQQQQQQRPRQQQQVPNHLPVQDSATSIACGSCSREQQQECDTQQVIAELCNQRQQMVVLQPKVVRQPSVNCTADGPMMMTTALPPSCPSTQRHCSGLQAIQEQQTDRQKQQQQLTVKSKELQVDLAAMLQLQQQQKPAQPAHSALEPATQVVASDLALQQHV